MGYANAVFEVMGIFANISIIFLSAMVVGNFGVRYSFSRTYDTLRNSVVKRHVPTFLLNLDPL